MESFLTQYLRFFDKKKIRIMTKVQRTDEVLWEKCTEEGVTAMGKFSARAMQRAVLLFKEWGRAILVPSPIRTRLLLGTAAKSNKNQI